jgi:hypothetical protein
MSTAVTMADYSSAGTSESKNVKPTKISLKYHEFPDNDFIAALATASQFFL